MKCISCDNQLSNSRNDALIELRKKLSWLNYDTYNMEEINNQLDCCCIDCINSMNSDLDGEISAVVPFQKYSSKFVSLPEDHPEYNLVATRFRESVSDYLVDILRIEKHHNEKILLRYQTFKDKNNSADGEQLMFHGSRHKNYTSILDDGFKVSCSKDGLLGVGIYFATKASYSITGFSESLIFDEDKSTVGNMLACWVYPTIDTGGKIGDNYCVRNDDQCYPAYIIYYRFKGK